MSDGIGLAEVLLGLPGSGCSRWSRTTTRWWSRVETTASVLGCRGVRGAGRGAGSDAGRRARSGVLRAAGAAGVEQAAVAVPGAAVRRARRGPRHSEHVDAQAVLTRRAGVEACRQVGENARPVSSVADELGVCWWTIMNAVIEHGTPLVDDPDRVGPVRQLGVDETSFLAANRHHATIYATGLVDLERHVVIDMVEGNSCR